MKTTALFTFSFLLFTSFSGAFAAGEKIVAFGNGAAWAAELGEPVLDFTSADETPRHVTETIDAKRCCRGKVDVGILSFAQGEAAAIDTLIGLDWGLRYVTTRICDNVVVVPLPPDAPDAAFVNEAAQTFAKRKGVIIAKGSDAAAVRDAVRTARTPDLTPAALKETSYNGWCHVRRMTEKRQEIIADPVKKYDIVFFGDSITHGFDRDHPKGYVVVTNMLANYRCLNIGYGADQTQHLLWRGKGGELDGYTAKMFCLMIGTNNGRWGHAPKDIAAGVKAILDLIAAKHPESKILLLPVFPRGRTPQDGLRKKNAETSALIAKFADGERVLWLDFTAKLMEPDGTITKEMMPDALHPAAPGYKIWFSEMLPIVRRICGNGMGGNWEPLDLKGVRHAAVAEEPSAGRPSPLTMRGGVAYVTDDNGDTTANLIWRIERGLLKGLEAKAVVIKTGNRNADPFQDVFCGIVAAARLAVAKGPANAPVVIMPLDATTKDADFVNRDLGRENIVNARLYYRDLDEALRISAIPACMRTKSPCADFGTMGSVGHSRKNIADAKVCCFGGAADAAKMGVPTNRPVRCVYGCDLATLLWRARGGDFKGFKADRILVSLPEARANDPVADLQKGLTEIFDLAKRDQPQAVRTFVTYAGMPKLNAAMKDYCETHGIIYADLQLKLVHGAWSCTISDDDNKRLGNYVSGNAVMQ